LKLVKKSQRSTKNHFPDDLILGLEKTNSQNKRLKIQRDRLFNKHDQLLRKLDQLAPQQPPVEIEKHDIDNKQINKEKIGPSWDFSNQQTEIERALERSERQAGEKSFYSMNYLLDTESNQEADQTLTKSHLAKLQIDALLSEANDLTVSKAKKPSAESGLEELLSKTLMGMADETGIEGLEDILSKFAAG